MGITQDNSPSLSCKCVIFRLDDVTDFGISVKSTILDQFLTENRKLTVAIILDKFGKVSDGTIFTKVKEGYDNGLFELAIHGLNHTKYSELDEEQQKADFIEGNNKLLKLFGNKSKIFAPPFNEFNSDTIRAMAESGLNIFSTSYRQENIIPNPYKARTLITTNSSEIPLSEINVKQTESNQTSKKRIYHVPYNTAILDLTRRGFVEGNLTEKVLSNVNRNIAKYGFSVITLHPTDFATFNASGNPTRTVDPNKLQVLVNIIDTLDSNGISIISYSDLTSTPALREIPIAQQERRHGIKNTDNIQHVVVRSSFPTNVIYFDDNVLDSKKRRFWSNQSSL